MYIIQE
jgi:hypothetical protein